MYVYAINSSYRNMWAYILLNEKCIAKKMIINEFKLHACAKEYTQLTNSDNVYIAVTDRPSGLNYPD